MKDANHCAAKDWFVNAEPLLCATHHCPPAVRAARSDLPSLLKSPTTTSCQPAEFNQVVHAELTNDEPLLWATYHCPQAVRPARSDLPSPLKSPTTTSCQPAEFN